ncbi:Uncharacterized protein APZ42_001195, partial [Daphnia magna]
GRGSADIRLVAALSEEWYLLAYQRALIKAPPNCGPRLGWAEIHSGGPRSDWAEIQSGGLRSGWAEIQIGGPRSDWAEIQIGGPRFSPVGRDPGGPRFSPVGRDPRGPWAEIRLGGISSKKFWRSYREPWRTAARWFLRVFCVEPLAAVQVSIQVSI